MAQKVKVIVLRTAGTNCDMETANAFSHFGASAERVHINRLFNGEVKLADYHILAIPGGFTYGDDIESGKILANEIKSHLAKDIARFVADKKLIIGICNGFQVLAKAGILPGPTDAKINVNFEQNATLTFNDSAKFEDRWTHLKVNGNSVWTKDVKPIVYFPVAHAEGKFVPIHQEVLSWLKTKGQIAFQYCRADGSAPVYPENPNGSVENIAGVTDQTGRILGLMPHPERHLCFENHPFWTRLPRSSDLGDGAKIFQNGVEYIKKTFKV